MKSCYIFGAGEYSETPVVPENDSFIIAADAGLKYCIENGIKADATVGDFDSYGSVPELPGTVKLPCEKDVTDMHAAVLIAKEHGYKDVKIYGGTGGRPDHTTANYSLIAGLSQEGIHAVLFGKDFNITAVTDGEIRFDARKSGIISVFSWTEISEGVTLNGLKYPLTNHTLTNTFALGVSNAFTGKNASVSVKNGTLIVMYENLA